MNIQDYFQELEDLPSLGSEAIRQQTKKFKVEKTKSQKDHPLEIGTTKTNLSEQKTSKITSKNPVSKDKVQQSKEKMQQPKDKVQQPKEKVQQSKEKVQQPKEKVQQPKDKVQQSKDKVQQSKEKVQQPKEKVQQPKEKVQQPKEKVQQSKDKVQQPKDKVQQPKEKVQQSKDKVQQPKAKVQQPKDKVQQLKEQAEQSKEKKKVEEERKREEKRRNSKKTNTNNEKSDKSLTESSKQQQSPLGGDDLSDSEDAPPDSPQDCEDPFALTKAAAKKEKFLEKQAQSALSSLQKSPTIGNLNKALARFAQEKNLEAVFKCWDLAQSIDIKRNEASYSSYLNALVRCGEAEMAQKVFAQLKNNKRLLNAVSYTVMVKLYCESANPSRDLSKALLLISEMKREKLAPNVRTYNTILRGCVRSGNAKFAQAVIEKMTQDKVEQDLNSWENLVICLCQNFQVKNVWGILTLLESQKLDCSVVALHLSITLALTGQISDCQRALKIAKRGLNLEKRKLMQQNLEKDAKDNPFARTKNDSMQRDAERVTEFVEACGSSSIDLSQNFSLELIRLSQMTSQQVSFVRKQLEKYARVKVEVCSGHGDWVVDQASNHKDTLWIAIEIRFDRTFATWWKAKLSGVENLIIVCGDGKQSLQQVCQPETVSEIFINFPEPPVWKNSMNRLLGPDFFVICHQFLKSNGALQIVTDNELYCHDLGRDLMQMDSVFKPHHSPLPFVRHLPEEFGTSSYFDHLWKKGNHVNRFWLSYLKIEE